MERGRQNVEDAPPIKWGDMLKSRAIAWVVVTGGFLAIDNIGKAAKLGNYSEFNANYLASRLVKPLRSLPKTPVLWIISRLAQLQRCRKSIKRWLKKAHSVPDRRGCRHWLISPKMLCSMPLPRLWQPLFFLLAVRPLPASMLKQRSTVLKLTTLTVHIIWQKKQPIPPFGSHAHPA